MSTINKKFLEKHTTSKEGIVKSYRTLIDNLTPPPGKENEFRELVLKIKSAVVIEECLSKSIESFLALKKYYHEDTGYYSDSQCIEAHALFTQAALFYRSSFVRGNLTGTPIKNLNLSIQNNPIHNELRNYIDKKVAHVDENHQIKSRYIGVTLTNFEEHLKIESLSNSSEETYSYHISTIEDIIEHISSILTFAIENKSSALTEIKEMLGEIKIC